MNILHEEKDTLLIRFDTGDDVISKLMTLAREREIFGGTFTAIGAAQTITLSYYNLTEKVYEDHTYEEDMEITSVTGNISWMDNNCIIHAHGTFANQRLEVIGGHIKSLIISATGEVVLQKFSTKLTRAFDEKTGLNLLSKQ